MSFQKENGKIYSDPAVFGLAVNELQGPDGKPFAGPLAELRRWRLAYTVDIDALARALPEGFELISPALVLNLEMLSKVRWLAGRSVNRLEVQVPVSYKGKKGLLNLVTWEDNGDSILYGRDVHGISKVWANFKIDEDEKSLSVSASSWGFAFVDIKIDKSAAPVNTVLTDAYEGIFHLRYLPRTGEGFTHAEVSCVSEILTEKPGADIKPCGFSIAWHRPTFADMPIEHTYTQRIAGMAPAKNLGGVYVEFDSVQGYAEQAILEERLPFPFDPDKMYMMPATFGACVGPRRRVDGKRYVYDNPIRTERYAVVYEVEDVAALAALVPEGLELAGKHVVIAVDYLSEIAWLAQKRYALIAVNLPVRKRGDKTFKGAFMAAIWENEMDPILTGREQLGFSKVLCEIGKPVRDGKKVAIVAKEYGNEFFRLELDMGRSPQNLIRFALNATSGDGIIHYKTFPRCDGDFSVPAVDCLCLQPKEDLPADAPVKDLPKRNTIMGRGGITWTELSWEQSPAHFRIIKALADMRIKRVYGGANILSWSRNDLFNQRVDEDYKGARA